MENRKIKSVRRKDNSMSYRRYAGRTNFWVSNTVNEADYYEYIPEEVILNCPLFEVEYESEPKIWRAERHGKYIFIDGRHELITAQDDYGNNYGDDRYELGNYFHPQDDAKEIEQVRKEIAEVYARSKARRAR